MSPKVDQAVGAVTISLGWLTAVLTPQDAAHWAEVLMSMGPLLLIMFLLWRIRMLDKQLAACRAGHDKTNERLLIAFTALRNAQVREGLPTPEELLSDSYDLKKCLGDSCNIKED